MTNYILLIALIKMFVSVGPKLAKEIQDPMSEEDWNDNLKIIINIVNIKHYND